MQEAAISSRRSAVTVEMRPLEGRRRAECTAFRSCTSRSPGPPRRLLHDPEQPPEEAADRIRRWPGRGAGLRVGLRGLLPGEPVRSAALERRGADQEPLARAPAE